MTEFPKEVRRSSMAVLIHRALPATTAELMKKFSANRSTIQKALSILREYKFAHLGAWESTTKSLAPVWAKGEGYDAERPNPRDLRLQRLKRHYQKVRVTRLAKEKQQRQIPEIGNHLRALEAVRRARNRERINQQSRCYKAIKRAANSQALVKTTFVGGNPWGVSNHGA